MDLRGGKSEKGRIGGDFDSMMLCMCFWNSVKSRYDFTCNNVVIHWTTGKRREDHETSLEKEKALVEEKGYRVFIH
jgi:hypothetical protein